jgi:hypothetical protein
MATVSRRHGETIELADLILRVVEAAGAVAFPPQRFVVGVSREAGDDDLFAGDAGRRLAGPRDGGHLDGRAGVARAAPVVAARRP